MVKNHSKKIVFFIAACFVFFPLKKRLFSQTHIVPFHNEKKAIIFDIGGVLVETNHKKAVKRLGVRTVSSYYFFDWKTPHNLRPTLYSLLHKTAEEKTAPILDPYGDPLPYLFYQVLKGDLPESECYETVRETILNNSSHFCSKREHELCLKLAEIMFDSKTLVSLQQPVKDGVALLKECHEAGHEIFIFSNYGKEAFENLKEAFPDIFKDIPQNNIVVSAHVKSTKPEQNMYHTLIDRLKNAGITPHPSTCFFIDDQKHNVDGIESFNIYGILKNKNFKSVRKTLSSHGIIV